MKHHSNANFSFAKVSPPNLQRSVFNRSTEHKTTMNEGYLVPIYVDEVLPGDTMNMKAQVFARLSTLLTPIMDNLFLDMHWWFCPARLLWEHWENFMAGYTGRGSVASQDYEIPQITSSIDPLEISFQPFSLGDYFGLPVTGSYGAPNIKNDEYGVSALPFRMYNLVYNEWYRDENLQDELAINIDDGPDDLSDYSLKRRNKRPDYFTTCLPWPQKGNAVLLPLGSTAPVVGDGQGMSFMASTGGTTEHLSLMNRTGSVGSSLHLESTSHDRAVGDAAGSLTPLSTQTVLGLSMLPTHSHVYADLTNATSASINNIRLAVAMQQVLERDARGGTRYTEHLVSHWHVSAEDYRLQRPEYLGGSSERVTISQVPQTSAAAGTPQANLAAYGTISTQSRFSKSFVEHGYVMCLVNVRADLTYQEGIRRMWSRKTRWEFFLPDLAHLGEQTVLTGELTFNPLNSGYLDVFGYQERWAEYRYFPSMVTGAFRSQYAASLDVWHLALDFIGEAPHTGLPVLNGTFMEDNAPVSRIIAVSDEGESTHFIVDSYFQNKHARPLPVYSNPGLLRF